MNGDSASGRALVLRVVLVVCQASTIALTWPLWQARASPPLLPLLPMFSVHGGAAQFSLGFALLATLALVLWRPRTGIAAHFAVLALAIAMDETRMQPQVFSLALLLLATLPGSGARSIALAHLVALWLWSGLHKLFSPEYLAHGGVLVTHRFTSCPASLANSVMILAAALEVGLGVAALFARTRPCARVAGAVMHLALLAWLSPLVLDWNESVWPWNVALAFAAWVGLGPDLPKVSDHWRAAPRWARAVVLVELFAPAGYEVGLVPAPLAHALYCMSTPHATWIHQDGTTSHLRDLPELNVFLPGTYHALIASFNARSQPEESLLIVEQRVLMRAMGVREIVVKRE